MLHIHVASKQDMDDINDAHAMKCNAIMELNT
jgi:hypothetical protein